MAYRKYVELANYDNSGKKRFKLIMWRPEDHKSNNLDVSITGKDDIQIGHMWMTFNTIFKVRYSVTDSSYGTAAELQAFFRKNSTSGTNNVKLRFTPFDDAITYVVMMLNSFPPENQIPILNSPNSYWHVPITLKEVIE